jgi:hypothetical protein
MRVTIVTSVYSDYDELKPIVEQEGADVDWVCVTDRPRDCHGWRLVIEPRPAMHPNVAAKRAKMLPWEYTDTDVSVWIDASFRVKSARFIADTVPYARPIAQFKHPWRDCVYKEAESSLGLPKYVGLPIEEQMQVYRSWCHPEHWGLWSTGFIVRQHVPEVRVLCERWLRTCQEWGFQDQLSQAPHLRALGITPEIIPGCHTDNEWLVYEGSARH